MKKLEVSEQFVKEAHQSACSDWKKKIEKEFPSLFEFKWQIGKWYKLTWDDSVAFVCSTGEGKSGGTLGYGFTSDGVWESSGSPWGEAKDTKRELATPTEIESMLWKEAEKRGYKEGVKYISLYTGEEKAILNGVFFYEDPSEGYCLIDNCKTGGNYLYMNGKWAEIIDTNKEIKEQISRLEKELKEIKDKVK